MLDTALIFDAALLPAMLIAMLAGILSFLSPCVLPIVPPYLAYMSGTTVADFTTAILTEDVATIPLWNCLDPIEPATLFDQAHAYPSTGTDGQENGAGQAEFRQAKDSQR